MNLIKKEKLAKCEKSKYEKTQVIQELEVDVKILAKEILELDNKISDIATAKNKNGSKFVELETIFKNASKDLVKIKTQYELKCQTINEETESRNELLASKKEVLIFFRNTSLIFRPRKAYWKSKRNSKN